MHSLYLDGALSLAAADNTTLEVRLKKEVEICNDGHSLVLLDKRGSVDDDDVMEWERMRGYRTICHHMEVVETTTTAAGDGDGVSKQRFVFTGKKLLAASAYDPDDEKSANNTCTPFNIFTSGCL